MMSVGAQVHRIWTRNTLIMHRPTSQCLKLLMLAGLHGVRAGAQSRAYRGGMVCVQCVSSWVCNVCFPACAVCAFLRVQCCLCACVVCVFVHVQCLFSCLCSVCLRTCAVCVFVHVHMLVHVFVHISVYLQCVSLFFVLSLMVTHV